MALILTCRHCDKVLTADNETDLAALGQEHGATLSGHSSSRARTHPWPTSQSLGDGSVVILWRARCRCHVRHTAGRASGLGWNHPVGLRPRTDGIVGVPVDGQFEGFFGVMPPSATRQADWMVYRRGIAVPPNEREEGAVTDQFDVDLVDHALLDELQMTTDLIIAATESDAPLTSETIDRILGIPPTTRGHPTPVSPGSVPRPRSSSEDT